MESVKPKLCSAALLFGSILLAQEFRGTVSGVITDGTGGLVAGAKVVVVETHTRTTFAMTTEATGQSQRRFCCRATMTFPRS